MTPDRRKPERPEAGPPARNPPAARNPAIPITEALAELRAGRMIIVVDDAHRENEGDIIFAAEKATPEMVNFALKHGRGILCAPMDRREARARGPRAAWSSTTPPSFGTPFTESVDARRGTTTGTSAFDRARTLRVLADRRSRSRGPGAPRPRLPAARACRAACCAAPGTPRRSPTLPARRACARWARCARSSPTTAT